MTSTLYTYSLGLQASQKIRDLNSELELWQIGEDRLPEYVDLFTNRYNAVFKEHFERNQSRTDVISHYRGLSERSVNIGVVHEGRIIMTAIALLSHRRGLPDKLPNGLEQAFDLPHIASQLNAHQLWYASRFSVDAGYKSPAGRKLIYATIPPVVREIMEHEHGQLMLSCLARSGLRMWRRLGVHWRPIDSAITSIKPGWDMWRVYLRGQET